MPTEFGDAITPAPANQTEFGDTIAGTAPRNAQNPNMLGPSPDLAAVGNRVFSNIGGMLQNLPSGVMAFIRHPIDTTKAAVGQMDLEHPEKSSGLLGLPDVLYRKLQSGEESPQQVAGDILTLALPGATTERAGLAGEAISRAAKSLTSKALNAVPSNAVADVTGLVSPRAANAIRVANRIKRGVQAFQNAGEEGPLPAIPWSQIIARAAEKEPAALPASVTQELTRPSEVAPVAPTVPQAAPPAPAAPIPPETPTQATGGPVPAAKAEPSAAEVAQTKARGLRAATAETLSQALSDVGKTAADVRPVRVWDWPKIASQVGVDFPVTHSARLKLIRDTLARLQQREAKP